MKNKINRKKCTPLNCSQSIELLTSRVRVCPSFQVVSEASGASARVSARPSLARLNNNNFKIHYILPPPPQLPIRKFWLSCCFARSICKKYFMHFFRGGGGRKRRVLWGIQKLRAFFLACESIRFFRLKFLYRILSQATFSRTILKAGNEAGLTKLSSF